MLYSEERLHPDDLPVTAETWLHLLQLVSEWVFRKCNPVTARTACTWAEGAIFVCEAVT